MPLLRFKCGRCQQTLMLGAEGFCETQLKDGTKCGFMLPIQYEHGNAKYRKKLGKHTTMPDLNGSGTYSWVDSSGTYPFCQQAALNQGSLHLDKTSNYLFLWVTPRGKGPLASVYYGSPGSVSSASGVVMPLNSKPQNLHHFYDNYRTHFELVADGQGLEIQAPDCEHTQYQVYRSGNLIYSYEPSTKTEVRYPESSC